MTDTPAEISITPVHCTHDDCTWAGPAIPDHYIGSRNGFLRRHLADDHKPTPEPEDQPGYDGPTYDSYDRLQMWMDKSVPPADRDRLIAEYREQVLTEAAELIQAWHDQLPSEHECCDGNAASRLLAARTTTDQEN